MLNSCRISIFPYSKKEIFYSDSGSDSDDEEPERRIHVEIRPLNNETGPISASVDELRATVETISLSPFGDILSVRTSYKMCRKSITF